MVAGIRFSGAGIRFGGVGIHSSVTHGREERSPLMSAKNVPA